MIFVMRNIKKFVCLSVITLFLVITTNLATNNVFAGGNDSSGKGMTGPVIDRFDSVETINELLKNTPIFFRDEKSGREVIFFIDDFGLGLLVDGVLVWDLQVGRDRLDRPVFYSTFINGFFELDPAKNLIVKISGLTPEPIRFSVKEGEVSTVLRKDKCNCFGTGTASMSCSDQNCDVGTNCGAAGAHRNCRWSAGGGFANFIQVLPE